jgi:hypothetical protein
MRASPPSTRRTLLASAHVLLVANQDLPSTIAAFAFNF